MNTPARNTFIGPNFAVVLVVSWLSVRGILWITKALFFQEAGLTWHASFVDGLLGVFCISLAIQLSVGVVGVSVPVIIMLMLHVGMHLHRWVVIDPHSWWAISTLQRLQIVFESGISLVLACLLLFFPPGKIHQPCQE